MNKKIFSIFAFLVFTLAIFAVGVQASSVTGNLFWDSTTSRTLTINDGNSAMVLVSGDTIFESSMTIEVNLVDSSGSTVSNLLSTFTKSDTYTKDLTLTKLIYINSGTYKVKLTVTAASGSSVSDELTLIVNSIPDTTFPVVTILTPTNGATYTVNKTQMVATITENNLKECWYNLGSGNVSFACSNGANVINLISSKQGSNTWKVYAKDFAGNIGSDTVTFTVQSPPPTDTTSPIVNITNPLDGATYTSHRTSLTFNVYDLNLKSCFYSLNGATFVSIPSASNGPNTVTGITSVNGSNTWTVKCIDNSNNVGMNTVSFIVNIPEPTDTTAPVVKITDPTDGATYVSNRTHLDSTITENNLDQCWYNLGSGNVSFSCSNGTNTINSIASVQGSNTWKVYAKDVAGNFGMDTITFTVTNPTPGDSTAPVVDITNPVDGGIYTTNRTQMNVIITEDNLDQCWYNLGSGNVSFSCSNGTNTINSIASVQGSNTWKVYAKDLAGNVGMDTIDFAVISSPSSPLDITPIIPTNGQIIKGNIIFKAIVNKLSNVTYNIDSGANVTMTETLSLTFVSSSLSLSLGTHIVTFCAKDSTETVCKPVTFEVVEDKKSDKKTCSSCKINNNGPLNETIYDEGKNYAGKVSTEEYIYLNVKESNKLNFIQRILLWISNLFR